MKKTLTFLATILITATIWAQSPEKMSYQAVIRNSSNELVTAQSVGMRISVIQGSANGTVVYSETQTATANANGLVSIEIGTGSTDDNFSAIDWSVGTYFIQTETDPEGGTNYTITGTSQLLSVPYALYAKTSGSSGPQGPQGIQGERGSAGLQGPAGVPGINGANGDFGPEGADGPQGPIGLTGPAGADGLTTSVNGVTQVGGAITLAKSDIGLGDVDNTTDAAKPISTATQTALDQKVDKDGTKALSSNDYTTTEKDKLAAITGTNTGDQTLSGMLTSNPDADGKTISNLAEPTAAQDAATKAYVDDIINLVYRITNPTSLISAGVSVSDLLTAGVSVSDLLTAGVSVSDLFDEGIGVGILAQSGASESDLETAGLVGSVLDVENNSYKWVKIGTQVWMAENLKTTKYSDGTDIGTTSPVTLDIRGETAPAYQWAYDGDENNVATYGRLYTWWAVADARNVCPAGWRVPTDAEWTALETFVGGSTVVGGKLKEIGITHWRSPNTGTDEVGFTALPGGSRYDIGGPFIGIRSDGWWWSATEYDALPAWYTIWGHFNCCFLYSKDSAKALGFSVRCLRD